MATNNSKKKLGETLLISEELLKLYSPLSKNISVDKVFPFLHLAQPFYIQPILGDALLEELQYQIDNDELTDLNKALIIKIAMPLSCWSTYLALRSLTYSITEKGITKETSENSSTIDYKELGTFVDDVKNKAEMATELLIKYLCKCQDNYPKWSPSSTCDCEKYYPTSGSTEQIIKPLIYFPNKGSNGCNGCTGDHWISKR